MPAVHMERSDHARNLARFYNVGIQPTLFGDWAAVCRWGRLGAWVVRGDGLVRQIRFIDGLFELAA